MTASRRRFRPARLGLLLAALLHLLGAEFGPLLHPWVGGAAVAASVQAPGDERDAQAPGHLADCALCQTLTAGSLALPAGETAVPAPERAAAFVPAGDLRAALPRLDGAPSLARAPPALS